MTAAAPTIGRDSDGTMFVIRDDGAVASFQDGVWRPGIPWSGEALCQYRAVTVPAQIERCMADAADALAAFLRAAAEDSET